jgi:hypothetical protein
MNILDILQMLKLGGRNPLRGNIKKNQEIDNKSKKKMLHAKKHKRYAMISLSLVLAAMLIANPSYAAKLYMVSGGYFLSLGLYGSYRFYAMKLLQQKTLQQIKKIE